MGDEFTFEDILIILKRRMLLFAAPAIALFLLGLFVVMLLPAKFSAQGVILVVGAEIPSDLVRSTISAYAQERIEQIKTRVMTRARVLEIADKYNLFPRNRGYTDTQRVSLIRQNLSVKYFRAEGAQTGAGRDNTIAFAVSYTDRSADKAYQAANEIISTFLTEDVRTRTTGASNTTEFFKSETGKLAAQVSAMEEAIAKFKTQNGDALPETLDSRKMALDRAQQELTSVDASTVTTEEELRFIETQLTSTAATSGEGGGELARKRAELISCAASTRTITRRSSPRGANSPRSRAAAAAPQDAKSPLSAPLSRKLGRNCRRLKKRRRGMLRPLKPSETKSQRCKSR